MKKFFTILSLLFILTNICQANEIKVTEYLDKSYIGISYIDAFNDKIPFVLILVNPNDIFLIMKMVPIAEIIYKEFKNSYNFCIINTKKEENEYIINYFNPKKLPIMYIIDPNTMLYEYIPRKYYNKKDLKIILTNKKGGIN